MRPARQISSFSYSVMQGSALGQYERYMLRRYFLAVLVQFTREEQGRLPEDLLIWYAQNETLLQINIPKLKQYASAARRDRLAGNPVLKLTLAQAERHYGTMPPPSAFQRRVDWVAKTLSLDPIEKASLGAISRLIQLEPFSDFAAAAGGRWIEERDEVPAKFICTLLGLSRGSARRIFQHQGTLQKLGLLEDRGGDDFRPSDFIQKLLRQRTTDERILEQTLLTENYAPSLSLNDFDHMSEERDQLIAILRGCLDQREKGAGILLHGAPGTGKTEFAALLGQACNARIIFAGETDREGGEPSRHEHIAHLSLLSAIGSRAGRVIVVVDEADDIFSGVDSEETFRPTGKRTGSKAFINRMVENCSIPTVWISNHPERMGASVVRRMLYAAEFRKPGAQIRRRIVDRHAETLNVQLDEMSRANLARLPVAPAIIASSLRAARLGHGNGAMALATAKSLQNALGEGLRARLRDGFAVVVHCRGGLGRAGMITARLLVELGMHQEQAISEVRSVRPGAIETRAQEDYVLRQSVIPEYQPNTDEASLRSRAIGSMLGLAVGDAIGTTLEFSPRDSYEPLTDMVGGGPFKLKRGQWTDDTAMMIALAESLVHCGKLDEADLLARFYDWYQNGAYSCTGDCFDIGITTSRALERWHSSGILHAGSVEPETAGNGSLMRLAPIAVRFWRDRKQLRDAAARQSKTTHGASEAVDACVAYAEMLADAIEGAPRSTVLRSRNNDYSGAIASIVAGSWQGKVRRAIRATGYVAHSMEASIWSVGRSGDFRGAVLTAANLGEDADTTAAIAGQLAGALYGLDNIPVIYLKNLEWRDSFKILSTGLFEAGIQYTHI